MPNHRSQFALFSMLPVRASRLRCAVGRVSQLSLSVIVVVIIIAVIPLAASPA
jgi:hypothetical protein